MNSQALIIKTLDHNFGNLKALDNINLSLKQGDYSILLGLNGAGKTTLFSLITRLYDNQTGSIEIFSHNIKNNKKGYYFHIKFEGIGKTIEELEKAENIDEMLIRYLTVRVKKHDLEENFFEKKVL